MKKKALLLTVSITLFCLYGCVAPQQVRSLNTSSGRPEVTIYGVSKNKIKNIIVTKMLAGGCTMTRSDDYSVVFAKDDNSLGAAMIYGSKMNCTPQHRFSFNMIESGGNVRLFCQQCTVTNPGTGFERIHPRNQPAVLADLQRGLEQIKRLAMQ